MSNGRPSKEFKFKRNRDSLQFFIGGEYVGSFGIKTLCLMAKVHKDKNDLLSTIGI